jgi:ABC-type thiamin/hydroxymethylpyrimidine transport system permease subunit
MINANEGAMVILPPAATLTNATQSMSFDRAGFDQANIMVIVGTHTTTTAVITGLKIAESDTITSATSMTDIAALCASNTTSTSAVNAIPIGAIQGLGGVITEFQIDLRKRKKYVGLMIAADTVATAIASVIVRLTRGGTSKDTAAQKSLPLNLASTAVVSCMQVVAG